MFLLLSFRADSALHLVEPHELGGSGANKKQRQKVEHGVTVLSTISVWTIILLIGQLFYQIFRIFISILEINFFSNYNFN